MVGDLRSKRFYPLMILKTYGKQVFIWRLEQGLRGVTQTLGLPCGPLHLAVLSGLIRIIGFFMQTIDYHPTKPIRF